MARFDFAKVAAAVGPVKSSVKSGLQATTKAFAASKMLRFALAAIVFSAALTSGLAYILIQSGQQQQLAGLAEVSNRASQTFRDRFAGLNSDVLELARRVRDAGAGAVSASDADAEANESEAVASLGSGGPSQGSGSIEVRWRRQLEASIRELAKLRDDVLDLTYLGRFSGVPNGGLMVVRIERSFDGRLNTTEVDPRPDWDAEFLRRVMQGDAGVPLVSVPLISGGDDVPRHAVIRAATSVTDPDGSVVGLVLISLDLSNLLVNVNAVLPESAVPLLVSEEGAVLLHPDVEQNLTSAKGAGRVLREAYPDLLAAFNAQEDAHAFSYFGSATAQRLLRFEVGGEASERLFSWVLSEPAAEFELPSSAHLADIMSFDGVLEDHARVLLGGAALVICVPIAALLIRYKRRRSGGSAGVDDRAARKASALSERASKIEAENQALVEEVDSLAAGDAADSDSPDELPDLSTELSELAPESVHVAENASDDASEPADEDPDEHEAQESPADEAPVRAEEPAPAPLQARVAAEPKAAPSISKSGRESVRELAATRNRLEDELEEARQSALNELAAARERFEIELTRERERVIDQLVAESRGALDSEMAGLDVSRSPSTIPAVEEQVFDLRRLLTEVAAWMEGETHGRSGGFGIHCNRSVPDRLLGDPDWMGPLLVHIGRNAIRCSPDGPVELFVSCVDDGAAGVKLCFELSAGDTGLEVGEDGKIRERQPCGLQLTEEIVESMRGELAVETGPGSGSTLRVVVPMSLPS